MCCLIFSSDFQNWPNLNFAGKRKKIITSKKVRQRSSKKIENSNKRKENPENYMRQRVKFLSV